MIAKNNIIRNEYWIYNIYLFLLLIFMLIKKSSYKLGNKLLYDLITTINLTKS